MLPHNKTALAVAMLCGAGVHIAMMGSRLTMSLQAISLGGDSFTVGLLLALYGLAPLFIAVPTGRWIDRTGVYRPLLWTCACMLAGLLIPAAVAHITALYAGALLLGAGVMMMIISLNNLTGAISSVADRPANFGWLALAYSIGMLIGPFAAGIGIDHIGHRSTLIALAASPLAMLGAIVFARRVLPRLSRAGPAKVRGMFDLFREPRLRGIYLVGAAVSAAYELHGFLAPVYGHRIGLSASTIGLLGSSVAFGVLGIRVAAPWLMTHVNEWRILGAALLGSGFFYALFVQLTNVPLLMLVSFLIGASMGVTQPVSMSLLHGASPEGRVGEALGLRTMIMNGGQSITQLSLGAVSGLAGIAPVIWAASAVIFCAGWYAERRGRREVKAAGRR